MFGAAFAGGWALAILLGLDDTGAHILQAVLFALGVFVMIAFIRAAQRVEPFTKRAKRSERETAAPQASNAYASLNKLNVCSSSTRRGIRGASTREKICPQPKKIVAKRTQKPYLRSCPISHVPVVVCQSVGIRTRGRTAAKG